MSEKVVFGVIFLGIITQLNLLSAEKHPRVDPCDPKEHFKPYVRISKKRDDKPYFEIPSAGFVDLRNQIGVTLCVNGPAYIYSSIEEEGNLTRFIPEMTVFKDGGLKMYQHSCFLINRLVNPGASSSSANPDDPGKYHRDNVIQTDSPPFLTEYSEVHGVKAFGITLLGNAKDYTTPSMFMFLESRFGYNDENLVISSSFGIIGRNAWKVYDLYTNSSLTIKPEASTETELCSREEGKDPFDKKFQRGHNRTDYKWRKLSDAETAGLTTPAPPTNGAAGANLTAEQRVGRIIDPNLTGKGYWHSSLTKEVKNPKKNKKKTGAPGLDGNGPHYRFDYPKDFEKGKPYSEIVMTIPPTYCVKLPDPIDTATCGKVGAGGISACDVLQDILQLTDRTADQDIIAKLDWKKQVLNFVEQTFSKICPQINERALQAVNSIFFSRFILEVHKREATLSQDQDPRWVTLVQELEHCNLEATQLEFYVISENSTDEVNLTPPVIPNFYLAGAERQNEYPDMDPENTYNSTEDQNSTMYAPKVPTKRKIQVKRIDGSMASVFHYEEAVEGDTEFNIPIDFMWKMFSTVAGYCNKLYTAKKSSVFPKLLHLFNDDFLALDNMTWTDTTNNHIYSQFMGDTGNWLNECLEGAYVHAGSEDYRPVRPLLVNSGQQLNYFTRIPTHG